MHSAMAIPIQKLFFITLILKVLSSAIGWKIGDPWIFGFVVPIFFMMSYIVLGFRRESYDVSDEKFADSCYYLGFIFTITSIIFSLFDLPNIGTKLPSIAARFGAAMVSTVLGLSVRVYLVSFRRDVADVMEHADTGVIEAAEKLREHFTIAYEKLKDFESRVDESTKDSIAKVEMQLEAMTKSYGDKLSNFFEELANDNQITSNQSLLVVKDASNSLASSVSDYTASLGASLRSLEDNVTSFSMALTDRLKSTTFPDDYFVANLANPISNLRNSTNDISSSVAAVADEVRASNVVLTSALKSLRTKATSVEKSLDRVTQLAKTQVHIVASSELQLNALTDMSALIKKLGDTLVIVMDRLGEQNIKSNAIAERVDNITAGNVQALELAATTQILISNVPAQFTTIIAVFESLTEQIVGLNKGLDDHTTQARALTEQVKNMHQDSMQTSEFSTMTQSTVVNAAAQFPVVMKTVREMADAINLFSLNLKQIQVNVEISQVKNSHSFMDDFGQVVGSNTVEAVAQGKLLVVNQMRNSTEFPLNG